MDNNGRPRNEYEMRVRKYMCAVTKKENIRNKTITEKRLWQGHVRMGEKGHTLTDMLPCPSQIFLQFCVTLDITIVKHSIPSTSANTFTNM